MRDRVIGCREYEEDWERVGEARARRVVESTRAVEKEMG